MKKVETSEFPKQGYFSTNELNSWIINSLKEFAVFTIDKELKISSWNKSAENLFGYKEEEVLGNHFEMIFTEEDRKNNIPEKEVEEALEYGKGEDERWHIHKGRGLFFASGLTLPLNKKDGEHIGFVKITHDITEKKKQTEELERVNQELASQKENIKRYSEELEELNLHKENILAVLSHDLRSPLISIIGTTEMLKSSYYQMEQGELEQILKILHKSAKRLLNMLDNLVEWARLKYASEINSPKMIKVAHYVEEVSDDLNETAASKQIKIQNEIDEDIMAYADKKMLHTILFNLISNAIKYSNSKSKIKISAKRKKEKIVVKVNDTGLGISKSTQEKLFIPQVETLAKIKEENKGAGIGLLLVKGFLDKMGGEIWVESKEGKGTTFYFTLPATKEEKIK